MKPDRLQHTDPTKRFSDRVSFYIRSRPHYPPAVLTQAGFRLRALQLDVAENDDFQAVLAYQGPLAYVYLADRSHCAKRGTACDWKRPPRYREDVLKAAQAYFDANRSGRYAPRMRNTLDMILTRRPRPFGEDDLPFEVYVGGGLDRGGRVPGLAEVAGQGHRVAARVGGGDQLLRVGTRPVLEAGHEAVRALVGA